MKPTNQELNIAVVKARGWKVFYDSNTDSWSLAASSTDGRSWHKFDTEEIAWSAHCIPAFTTDMNACKELLEEMNVAKWDVRINCDARDCDVRLLRHGIRMEPWFGTQPTLELAIVEAYLRWKGKWKEEWNL